VSGPLRVERTTFDDADLRTWWRRAYADETLATDTCFQSWEWNAAWDAEFVAPDPRRELVLLRIEDDDGIAAALPLFLQTREAGGVRIWDYLLWISDRLSPYPALITRAVDARPLWCAALGYLHRAHPRAWLQLRDQYDVAAFSECCDSEGWTTTMTPGESSFRLALPGFPGEEWMTGCTRAMRRTMRRAARAADDTRRVRWDFVPGGDSEIRATARRLSVSRFGARSFFAWEENARFFDRIDIGMEDLRHAVLRFDGAPAAILTGMLHAHTFYYWLAGIDPAQAHERPGMTNLYRTLLHLAEQEVTCFDFLRGREHYKLEFHPREQHATDVTIVPQAARWRHLLARRVQVLRTGRGTKG
jgi:CelD/BcsL family acetyltransferase involved in cellulose biosynthesis